MKMGEDKLQKNASLVLLKWDPYSLIPNQQVDLLPQRNLVHDPSSPQKSLVERKKPQPTPISWEPKGAHPMPPTQEIMPY